MPPEYCTNICHQIFVILEVHFHHEGGLSKGRCFELFYSTAELQKRADRADQLVLIFLGEKLVGANFYAFCNYAPLYPAKIGSKGRRVLEVEVRI